MLQRIHVKAFKSLEDVEVNLGRVNVFIGANGSGKSNLLEAIGVLGAAAFGRVNDEALLHRGVRPGVPALYKTSFRNVRPRPSIRLEAETTRASYSVELLNPLDAPKPAWGFKSEMLIDKKDEIKRDETKKVSRAPASTGLTLASDAGYAALKAVEMPEGDARGDLLTLLREYAIYAPDTGTLRGLKQDGYGLSREPVGLSGGRLAEAVTEVMHDQFNREFLDPDGRGEALAGVFDSALDMIDWAKDFGSEAPGAVPMSKSVPQPTRLVAFVDRYMATNRNRLSGYDASEGALYVLFMMVLACHTDSPAVLAVDNFDHALNPRLARALTRNICDWNEALGSRQLLLTSHNPLVLDGLPLRDPSVRLFTVERSRKGKTVVTRVTVDERLMQEAERGIPLSQQWVTGNFGGVPNI